MHARPVQLSVPRHDLFHRTRVQRRRQPLHQMQVDRDFFWKGGWGNVFASFLVKFEPKDSTKPISFDLFIHLFHSFSYFYQSAVSTLSVLDLWDWSKAKPEIETKNDTKKNTWRAHLLFLPDAILEERLSVTPLLALLLLWPLAAKRMAPFTKLARPSKVHDKYV